MLDICGVSEGQMPRLFESYECIGTVKPEIAKALGIPETVKVCAGAGDNAAAAVGTGVVGGGRLQYQPWHLRHRVHFLGEIRRGQQ